MRLFVDQLTNLDFSYLDEKRGLIGETWLANIELIGKLDEQGMVCDFGEVKRTIRHWLDTNIDHKLVIPARSKALNYSSQDGRDRFVWQSQRGEIKSEAPTEAHCTVDTTSITPESVASWCIEQLKPLFPSSVEQLILTFSTETIDGPYYHYSHGLKKHMGNCQRIAHGHRSKIEVWENGKLATGHMQQIAEEWRDIYIATEADCVSQSEKNITFQYESQQGQFSLSMPKTHCYLIKTDTTVELISEHLAKKLKQASPTSEFKVKAFEGLAKGAISEK